jgi:general secretion pathway protein A
MYMDLYGLREQPFGVTPNPRFLYFSSMHKAAMTSLVNSVCERRGFSALIAKPGMGKTSLIMQLLAMLRDSARTGFLFQTHGSTQEFLRALLQDIDAPTTGLDLPDMQRALNTVVMREARENRQLVIVVDEAQNLSDETLESVRLLSNFENPEAKLLHIIFAGQPPLADKLASPQLAQLRQRISVVAHLVPFTREQIAEYIDKRLKVAGYTGEPLFTVEAIDFIAQTSEGIPRNINNLCFHALSLGFSSRKRVLDLTVMQAAARALELKAGTQFHTRAHVPSGSVSQAAPHWSTPRFSPAPSRQRSRVAPPVPLQLSPSGSHRRWRKVKLGLGAFAGIGTFALLVHAGIVPADLLSHHGPENAPGATSSAAASTKSVGNIAPTTAPAAKAPNNVLSDPQPRPSASIQPEIVADAARHDALQPSSQNSATENTRVVHTERKENVEQLTRHYFGAQTGEVLPVVLRLNPGIATPPAALPEGTPVMIPDVTETTPSAAASGSANKRTARATLGEKSKKKATRAPVNVRIPRAQTIFQFAMEHYGKADNATVETIQAANPQIRDIYQTLQKGQSMTLPANLDPIH